MRSIIDKSLIPLYFFVGSGLLGGSVFGFHNLFNRSDVKLWKKDRMSGYPKKLQ